MKEHPMKFNDEEVRAILDGRKTMARRLVKPQPDEDGLAKSMDGPWRDASGRVFKCPFRELGGRLWVKEAWCGGQHGFDYQYRADWPQHDYGPRWMSSTSMRYEDSRITLEVVAVRVERVQDILDHEALAEGIDPQKVAARGWVDARVGFRVSWDSIYKKKDQDWYANPWVWVAEFKRI